MLSDKFKIPLKAKRTDFGFHTGVLNHAAVGKECRDHLGGPFYPVTPKADAAMPVEPKPEGITRTFTCCHKNPTNQQSCTSVLYVSPGDDARQKAMSVSWFATFNAITNKLDFYCSTHAAVYIAGCWQAVQQH